jgi:hypothetical protein
MKWIKFTGSKAHLRRDKRVNLKTLCGLNLLYAGEIEDAKEDDPKCEACMRFLEEKEKK